MEEKSLEEMMADISEGVTVASTTDEPMVIDMSNQPLPAEVIINSPIYLPPENEPKIPVDEVQEMVEEQHNDFYNQHIEKDMDVLEKEYVNMERKAAVLDARIIRFKADHKDIFEQLEKYEKEKEAVLEHKEDYREVIAHKLATIGEKKWKGMEIEFTYFPPSFKNVFNKKRFEMEQPNMYAKYVDKQPVKEYIKQKLSLLPILPEDLVEGGETNGNENIG